MGNRLIAANPASRARCAEDLVFSSYQSAGLPSLVVNNAHFRVEPEYDELPATEPDAI